MKSAFIAYAEGTEEDSQEKNPDCRLTSRPSASDSAAFSLVPAARVSLPRLKTSHGTPSSRRQFFAADPVRENKTTSRMSTPAPPNPPLLLPSFLFHIITAQQEERFHSAFPPSSSPPPSHLSGSQRCSFLQEIRSPPTHPPPAPPPARRLSFLRGPEQDCFDPPLAPREKPGRVQTRQTLKRKLISLHGFFQISSPPRG